MMWMWMWKMDGCEGKKREESGVERGFYLLDRTPRTSRHVTSRHETTRVAGSWRSRQAV